MIGDRIGPYEVLGKLGAGGMGEVYRAKDTNLDRDVAIKVLPESFALDADRVARFAREAKTLAALNHPNIAAIYGLEKASGLTALVLELVEGEDLSAHIARGAMPLAEALPIARQIADALEAAHEQGIVHRDLKPQNIKVRADGTVKVLDFGLAKAMDPAGGPAADVANSPTLTARATQMGLIIGTAAYMAPEQARGRAVDRRADIWAFGVVLYEMLTGRRLFPGDDVSETLASVLKDMPDFGRLPADVPPAIRRLLQRALDRNLADRLDSMRVVKLEIRDAGAAGEASGALVPSGGGGSRLTMGLALLTAILGSALAWSALSRPAVGPATAPVTRFALLDDPTVRVNVWSTSPFAISPDGKSIIFSADSGTGTSLWARTLSAPAPRLIPDTQGGYQPAISPDGEWVAFVVANHQIRKVRLDGGAATTVARIEGATAALAWTSSAQIIFEQIGFGSGIQAVSANSGSPALLIPLDTAAKERGQRRPLVLPGGKAVLYTSATSDGRGTTIAAFSLAGGGRSRLGIEGVQALGVLEGQLVYARRDGALMAVPFDAAGLRVLGEPRQLSEQVLVTGFGSAVQLSESGTLVAARAAVGASQLMLADEAGRATPLGAPRVFAAPRFSPDGRRIAVTVTVGDHDDLWVIDRASGELTRVTRERGGELVAWTPDRRSLIFLRGQALWTAPVDQSTEPRKLDTGEGRVIAASLAPDGRSAVIARRMSGEPGTVDREDLVRVPLEENPEITTLMASRSSGSMVRFGLVRVSPDGKWVAFEERNERQVHVRALDGVATLQVSDNGGSQPAWGPDGRRLYYRSPAGLVAADLDTRADLRVLRRPLMSALPPGTAAGDVSADGKTLLTLTPVDISARVQVTLNFAAELRRQLALGVNRP